MASTEQDPKDEPLDHLDTETVEDLDVEDDADGVRGGRDFSDDPRCVPT